VTLEKARLRSEIQHQQMEAGIVPGHYTQPSECASCGPVWLWEGAPDKVHGCPWCHHPAPPQGSRPIAAKDKKPVKKSDQHLARMREDLR